MARKPTTRVDAPVIEGTATDVSLDAVTAIHNIATIGDNMPPAADTLPEMADIAAHITATLNEIVKHTTNLEFARQRLAYDVMLRHDALRASGADVPTFDAMRGYPAANRRPADSAALDKRRAYLADMVTEFAGPYVPFRDCKTQDAIDQHAFRAETETSLRRALELCINLVACRCTRASFDQDKGAWRLSPGAFVPPGHMGAPMLMMAQDPNDPLAVIPRAHVWLENTPTKANYYVTPATRSADMTPIRLSMDHFNYCCEMHFKVASTPDTSGTESEVPATRVASRKARAPGSGNTTAQTSTPSAGNATPSADDTTPTEADAEGAKAEGTQDRSFYIAQLNAALMSIVRITEVSHIHPLTKADFSVGALNGLADIARIAARVGVGIRVDQDEVPASEPAVAAPVKRAARKRA